MSSEEYKKLLEQQTNLISTMQTQLSILQEQVRNMAGASGTESMKSAVSVPWPRPLEVDSGDPFESLEFFRNRWKDYCAATGMSKWGPEKAEAKASLLLNAIGHAAMKKYMDFGLNAHDKRFEEDIFKKMEEAIIKKTNIIYSRYVFNMKKQEDENFEEYLLTLRRLIRSCNYGAVEEELLRDHIVVSIRDGDVIKELLRKDDLSLESAIAICRASERATAQVADLRSEEKINKISHKKDHGRTDSKKNTKKCKFCGENHVFDKNVCPAFGKNCTECGGRNHFKKACKKRQLTLKEIQDNSSDESTIIAEVRTNVNTGHVEAPLLFLINNKWKNIYCTLDTGAQVCVMGGEYYKKVTGRNDYLSLEPSTNKLKCFNGTSINQHGVATFVCARNNKKYKIKFSIVDVRHEPLLSEKACVALGLIKYCNTVSAEVRRTDLDQILNEYKDVFEGYGSLPGEVNLEVDKSVPPCIQPARRIPVCLRDKLKVELEKLEEEGIIQKEIQHTDWVSNILIVSRDSKLRICLDPIPLNKALKRPNFQFTTLDEMLPELSKAKVFSTVDAKKGFWQCKLSESSSKLTTFWTPFGRYRWRRLPFGLSSSPEIFQQQLTSLLKDLKGIEIIADDILIYGVGDSLEEAVLDHNIKFKNLLQRLREVNCRLNKEKVNLLQTSVKFYGHILTNEGLKVDESKVESIKGLPTPTSSKDVLRFLGMVGYLGKFIDNLSTQAPHLRKLTRKDAQFIWSEAEDREFQNLKNLISKLPTLKYFDVNKEVVIECDASEYGLGAALYQDDQIICFASRCLTTTEKRYAQIEKEMLAVVFACKRFNQYVAGNCKTVIRTDHRPLINIVNKPLIEAPKRLQMMMLTLQKYNVQLEFIQGKQNVVADTLSRAPISDKEDTFDIEEKRIYSLINKASSVKYLKIEDKLLKKIKEETENDKQLQLLIKYIENGFPKYISGLPKILRGYHKFKHELSAVDGFVFRNNQLLIPDSMRKEMLQKVHVSHSGATSTLRLARGNIFWPGMSEDIKLYVERCLFCSTHAPSQQKLPLICHEVPLYPFQYISMDIFSVHDVKYLVTIDHYSDFYELDKVSTLTANEIISICKKNFARHGVPQRVCTDNATNFVNEYFKKFAELWNFKHVTSSPHHPQSNGKAEAAVKTAKKLVMSCEETKQDLWYCLLHQRNIPIQMDYTSPVQKIFSRRTRTGLPCFLKHLKPRVVQHVPVLIKERKVKVKDNVDKRCKDLVDLYIGQKIVTQLQPEVNNRWSCGTIVEKIDERSYVVLVANKKYRRNRCHIRPYSGADTYEPVSNPPVGYPEDAGVNNSAFSGFQMVPQDVSPAERQSSEAAAAETQEMTNIPASPIRRSGRNRTLPVYLRDYEI